MFLCLFFCDCVFLYAPIAHGFKIVTGAKTFAGESAFIYVIDEENAFLSFAASSCNNCNSVLFEALCKSGPIRGATGQGPFDGRVEAFARRFAE